MDYKTELREYAERAIAHRRHLHANPELSFQEEKTSAYIREQLAGLDIEYEDKYSGYAVVGYINGDQPGPTIGLRADIDALPVQENVDLPYKSQVDGVMHACGHDAHTAVLIELVKFLCDHKDMVKGRVKFIFQPAEEKLPGGAGILCKEGVLHDVDEIYAWHVAGTQPLGEVAFCRDACTAAVGEYRILIKGRGGHGGFPYTAKNPAICTAHIVSAINQLVTTSVDPLRSAVITTAYILTGTDHIPNIIPDECITGGNIRSLDNTTIDEVYDKIEEITKGMCEAFGCEYEYYRGKGYPATINADGPFDVMMAVCDEMGLKNTNTKPQMGAEDFSYYTVEKPACYIMIGMTGAPEGTTPAPHHNPGFCIDDENGIPEALEFFARVYEKAVNK